MIVVRYADDFVVGFQRRWEAESFLKELKERLAKFGLDLHPDKTRLIEFGRFAKADRKRRGLGKPETFDFMGMTPLLRDYPTREIPCRAQAIPKTGRAGRSGEFGKPSECGCTWVSTRWPYGSEESLKDG